MVNVITICPEPSQRGNWKDMRKIPIVIVIIIALAATMSIFWVFYGSALSLFVDRFRAIEITSTPIRSLHYDGTGKGGVLVVNDLHLNLTPANSEIAAPEIGTTKDDQLALSFADKVFAFGPVRPAPHGANEALATTPQEGDGASLAVRHSAFSWIEPFNLNFLSGQTATWRRRVYYQLLWKKMSGAKLEMLWRYEQYFYPTSGWSSGFMTRENSTGLVRVDVQPLSKAEH